MEPSENNDSSEEEDIVPLDNDFDFEFKKPMNRYLRIGNLGMTKKERAPHIVLDDVDVCDYLSNEDNQDY